MPCFELIFIIFALSLVACDDTIFINCQNSDVSLVISPASPVEFAATDCLTHNEQEICGVFPKCFCAPWECDDEIKIPGVDYDTDDLYALAIINSDGNEVDRVEFVQQELLYLQETDELEDFQNIGSGTNWTIGAAPTVTLPSSAGTHVTKILGPTDQITLEPGVLYKVDFSVTIDNDDFNVLNFYILDEDNAIILTDATNMTGFGPGTFDLSTGNFVAPTGAARFGWEFGFVSFGATGPVTMTMNSYSISRVVYSHLASFIPSDLNICDEQIQLKIYNITSSPDTEDYHSDCLDIKEDQDCSLLIEYSHNQNIRGIIYTEGSPELTLSLRTRATMRIQSFPQEDFAMQLTTGIEKISSSLAEKTLFEQDYAPYYWHRKLIMIFAHRNVSINGKYWKKQDEYAPTEGDRKQSLKMGEGLLTEDFTFRLNS